MPDKATVFRWLSAERHKDFCNQYIRARDIQADVLFDEIHQIADTPKKGTKTVRKGEGDNSTVETTEADMIEHRRLHDTAVDTFRAWRGATERLAWRPGVRSLRPCRHRPRARALVAKVLPCAGDRSKAVGEPPLMLGIAVYSPILDAVHAVKPGGQPKLEATCTPESILRAIKSLGG